MATDDNSWYTLASLTSNLTRAMQWCTLQIVCYSDTNITGIDAHWQFAHLQSGNSTILTLRNRGKGPHSAIAVFSATNQTQPGFAPLNFTDPTQQWYLTEAQSDSVASKLIYNVANGTNYSLAERGNDPMYMNQQVGLPSSSELWIPTRVSAIDDAIWSWTASSDTPSVPTTSANAPIDPVHQHSGPGHGAIAGLVIGVVAFVLLLTTSCYLMRRRQCLVRKHRDTIGEIVAPREKPRFSVTESAQSDSSESLGGMQHGRAVNAQRRQA